MASSASAGKVAGEEEMSMTPLQKHAAFFDRNHDGLIYPPETYEGFRAIGSSVPLSAVSALFINAFLSIKTKPGILPSPLLPIYIKNIHKGKHGSDTGVYDKEGRFVASKFEEIFDKFAKTNPTALTSKELDSMRRANRTPHDIAGRIGSWAEWTILYNLCKDEQGFLHKDTVRAVYDGSLLYKMEEENKHSKRKSKSVT